MLESVDGSEEEDWGLDIGGFLESGEEVREVGRKGAD